MAGARRLRLLAQLRDESPGLEMRRFCDVAADLTQTDGVGIMFMSGDIPRGSLCATDEVSTLIEELQFTLGEGPCIDAHEQGRPVAEIDLGDPEPVRWPAFTPVAFAAGVLAVFGFPLRLGEVRLGALDLYRRRSCSLNDEQHADALALADMATRAVLVLQADAPSGEVAAELERGADFHFVVHQASGMVAAQLEVTLAHALVRLRAFAFAHDRSLDDIAEDVVGRALRFHHDASTPGSDG
jgi:hypothetical protein